MDETIIEFVLAPWLEALADMQAVNARVYPWARAPQKTVTRPYVLYHQIVGGRLRSFSGPSGVSHPTIQLDFFDRDFLSVRRLANSVRVSLEAIAQGYLMNGRTVQVAIADDDFSHGDAAIRPEHGDEYATEHRHTLHVRIWFNES